MSSTSAQGDRPYRRSGCASVDLAELPARVEAMPPAAPFEYVDLFAGIGGFHAMLDHAGGTCVYVSEIDREARATYELNWVQNATVAPEVNTDITRAASDEGDVDLPEGFDVLAAGFPCQPFSKSGFQRGMDETRGTLFHNIARALEERRPAVIMLENVRNLAGPRHAHEWEVIIRTLREIGYRVSDVPTVFSPHFLPPELGGTPQVRDRVFIMGTYIGPERVRAELAAGSYPAPTVVRGAVNGWDPNDWRVEWVLDDDASVPDLAHYQLSAVEREWVTVWDDLVQRIWDSSGVRLPGFPLWADAFVPSSTLSAGELAAMPTWKSGFLRKNALFYDANRKVIDEWRSAKRNQGFASFPASRRKLEWQAQNTRSLWDTVMHFRPSGIRAKAPTYLPALVAITQTSIIGSRTRRITPHEAARLQGLARSFTFGDQRDQASYKQVGNGVAVGAAWHVFRTHVEKEANDIRALSPGLVEAVLAAGDNPSPDTLSREAFGAPTSIRFENVIPAPLSA